MRGYKYPGIENNSEGKKASKVSTKVYNEKSVKMLKLDFLD